jgi:hypothetical protein
MLRRHSLILAALTVVLLLITVASAKAQFYTPGVACPGGMTSGTLANSDGFLTCTSGTWVANPIWLGSQAASCSSTYAGQIQWTGSAFQGCNGTSWITLAGSSNLTLGTSASVTNPQRSGDTTTGLFSPATGAVAISSGGTEEMRITSSGVGVGTASPGKTLENRRSQ